jgi:hypothetical protein
MATEAPSKDNQPAGAEQNAGDTVVVDPDEESPPDMGNARVCFIALDVKLSVSIYPSIHLSIFRSIDRYTSIYLRCTHMNVRIMDVCICVCVYVCMCVCVYVCMCA